MKNNIAPLISLKIGEGQKANLLLVLLGYKPATHLNVYSFNDSVETVTRALHDAGLIWIEMPSYGNKSLVASFVIGHERKYAEQLQIATDLMDHYAIGTLLGYPESAVKAYTLGGRLLEANYPPDMLHNPLGFRLSKANFEEESALIRTWMERVKEISSETFYQLFPMKLLAAS